MLDELKITFVRESCPVRHRAVCSTCGDDGYQQLVRIKYSRRFQAGQTVIRKGDEMDFVASVISGTATLTRTTKDDRRQIIGILLASDFVSRPGRQYCEYEITAKTDLVLCCVPRREFEGLLVRFPDLRSRMLEMSLDDLDSAREWMLLLGRKTAREKIASLLLMLGRNGVLLHGNRENPIQTDLEMPLKREEMADCLGLTLETVSRQMSALARDGVIVQSGQSKIIILDFHRLLEESGDDCDGGIPS